MLQVCAGNVGISSRGRKQNLVEVCVTPVLPQQAHLIGLVQALQEQILNEVLHNVHIIALSCQVEGTHSILQKVRRQSRSNLRTSPSCTVRWELLSRCDPHTYLILGSLVCSSSNHNEHDLEAPRPGCKVNYCQAVLPQEEREKNPSLG